MLNLARTRKKGSGNIALPSFLDYVGRRSLSLRLELSLRLGLSLLLELSLRLGLSRGLELSLDLELWPAPGTRACA